jgi:hypothetical protein
MATELQSFPNTKYTKNTKENTEKLSAFPVVCAVPLASFLDLSAASGIMSDVFRTVLARQLH